MDEGVSTPDRVARILAAIATQDRAWSAFLIQLTPQKASAPADESWTAVDALIHVTAWIENALRVALLQGEPGAPDPGPTRAPAGFLHINVDRFNADVFEAHRGWARSQALAWSQQIHADLRAALTALPVERVLGGAGRPGARMWFWLPAFIHSRGHRRRVMRQLLGETD